MKAVLLIVSFVVLIFAIFSKKGLVIDDNKILPAFKRSTVWLLWTVFVLLFVFALGITIISSDSRGLRFTLGAISDEPLSPGLHFNMPIVQHVKTVTIRPIEVDFDISVGAEGAITKDNQTIGAQMTFFYVYQEDALPVMWKSYGEQRIKSIILKSVAESFKAQVGTYDIFVLPLSQDSIRLKTLKQARAMLASYPVTLTELKITNYDWSDDFDAQIKETMNRSQQVKQKEQELLITEQEAQKKVKQAEAEKTAQITKAEGEKAAAVLMAEAKAAEGEGIRKYNESIAQTIEIQLKLRQLEIEERRVDKWNGQYVPNNNYGPIPVQAGNIQGAK